MNSCKEVPTVTAVPTPVSVVAEPDTKIKPLTAKGSKLVSEEVATVAFKIRPATNEAEYSELKFKSDQAVAAAIEPVKVAAGAAVEPEIRPNAEAEKLLVE